MSGRGPSHGSARPRRPRPTPPDPARLAVFDTLCAVSDRDAYANLVLPGLLREAGLTGRDAALATELTYGTLRWSGSYDLVIDACSDRPGAAIDPPVRDALRLGCHQLLGSRVAAHAAVATTVDVARRRLGTGSAGFVNAVLRRVAARDAAAWWQLLSEGLDPVAALGVRAAHPRWVVSAFRDALGGDLAETEAALAADNEPPGVTLVARPGRCEVAELVTAGGRPCRWSPLGVHWTGDPAGLPAVRQGRAAVQDEGSQLVALALTDAPLDGTDVRWLDLAAGPGGKAALLGAVAAGRGARVSAVELHPHRADLVRAAVGDCPVDVHVGDGTDPQWGTGEFDRVLVDVPCTGLGALRRRPEARWRRQPTDLASLAPTQRALLRNALSAVRPGGVVAYVTCSPHLAETRAVVDDVLRTSPGVTVEDARPLLPGVPFLGSGPTVQLWPHRHGTDAMFLALLRR